MPKKPSKITPPISEPENPAPKQRPSSPKREGRTVAKPTSRAATVEKKSPPTPVSRAKTALPKTLPPPTNEEIALCAYFISQEKRALGLPGDPAQDWIEAESRLASERNGGKRARSSENRSK